MSATATLRRFKLTGVCPPAAGAVIEELTRVHPAPVWLIVAADAKTAEALAEDIAFFRQIAGGPQLFEALVFPESMPTAADMR